MTSAAGYTMSMLRQRIAAHDILVGALTEITGMSDDARTERARLAHQRDLLRAEIVDLARQLCDDTP